MSHYTRELVCNLQGDSCNRAILNPDTAGSPLDSQAILQYFDIDVEACSRDHHRFSRIRTLLPSSDSAGHMTTVYDYLLYGEPGHWNLLIDPDSTYP